MGKEEGRGKKGAVEKRGRRKRGVFRKHARGVLTRKTNPEKTQLVFGKIREMHKTEKTHKKKQRKTKAKNKNKKKTQKKHREKKVVGTASLGAGHICFWKENESFLMIALSDGNSCTPTQGR